MLSLTYLILILYCRLQADSSFAVQLFTLPPFLSLALYLPSSTSSLCLLPVCQCYFFCKMPDNLCISHQIMSCMWPPSLALFPLFAGCIYKASQRQQWILGLLLWSWIMKYANSSLITEKWQTLPTNGVSGCNLHTARGQTDVPAAWGLLRFSSGNPVTGLTSNHLLPRLVRIRTCQMPLHSSD